MVAYKTVAVAGATGNLGPSLVRELVHAGFEVTVLSRSGNIKNLGVDVKRVVQVDYDSEESLVAALKGQDAFVANIPNHAGQKILIDAAITAGVKHFIPSEFGCNVYDDPNVAVLPNFKDGKVVIQKYLKEKGSAIDWTLVVVGLFLDWGMDVGFIVNFKGQTRVFDGGDRKFSTTNMSDIGKAVAGILKHPEETKNRSVHVQSTCVTQNQLLRIAEKVKPGYHADTVPVSIVQLEKDSYAMLEKGEDVDTAMVNFIYVGVFAPQVQSVWDVENDNHLLGIKELSEQELEDVVKKYV